ncbi:hypothetical protein JTB14_027657 [Gonioctena quinquepunctata]|nr:hypothetical protein JTB14_027657 [Gonioctena quinquepunctata]
MLAVTLRYLASGCTFTELHYTYRIGISTASKIVKEKMSHEAERRILLRLLEEVSSDDDIEIVTPDSHIEDTSDTEQGASSGSDDENTIEFTRHR